MRDKARHQTVHCFQRPGNNWQPGPVHKWTQRGLLRDSHASCTGPHFAPSGDLVLGVPPATGAISSLSPATGRFLSALGPFVLAATSRLSACRGGCLHRMWQPAIKRCQGHCQRLRSFLTSALPWERREPAWVSALLSAPSSVALLKRRCRAAILLPKGPILPRRTCMDCDVVVSSIERTAHTG